MITPFLRSSLLNQFTTCQGRCFIEYGIGRRGETNRSALEGSTVHAVMEACARIKLAQQNGMDAFNHNEFGYWDCDSFDPIKFLDRIYDKYNADNPGIYNEDSYKVCKKCVEKALSFQNGAFDPRNADIFGIEYEFDIEIKKPWAWMKYTEADGTVKEQYLRLKGTVDLVVKVDENTLEVRDYKTNKNLQDWVTGKTKILESLYEDQQLQLYYYVVANLFPEYESILITLYFIKTESPFTLAFERKNLPQIEEFIRERYETIKDTIKPTWMIDDDKSRWKCKWCPHYKNKELGTKQTVCNFFRNTLAREGYDKTMAKHADWRSLTRYGAGGSVKDRE